LAYCLLDILGQAVVLAQTRENRAGETGSRPRRSAVCGISVMGIGSLEILPNV
jgi:hypothetical protein